MSLNRYDAARDVNEPGIVEGLRKLGVTIERLNRPCDLLCGWRGKNYLLEIKDGEKKPLTDSQRIFAAEWRGQFCVIWTLEQAVETIMGPSAIQGGSHDQGA